MNTRTDVTLCSLCEASCGLRVEHDGQRVLSIRANDRDVMSKGFICPKGVALADVQHDPDRVRTPQKRVGGAFEPVSWSEALADIGQRLASTQARHGRDAVGFYYGNPTGHNLGAGLSMLLLKGYLKTRNVFSSQSVDALPRIFVSYLLYGNQALVPVPDLDRTSHLLILGANPVVSNGSAVRCPDSKARLRAIRQRGGRVVVVDPRRTETADLADRHVAIRPGTDALLLAAMLRHLVERGLTRPHPLAEGLDVALARLAPFTPSRVAEATSIDAATIEALAVEFAQAPSAVAYARLGTCVQPFGSLTTWLSDLLNIVTGNLDRPGGSMFTTPPLDLAGFARKMGQTGSYATYRSRRQGLPEFNHELPVAAFADEIETPGPGQIKALVVSAGNPVLSLPNGRRLERAIAGLDLVVAIDIYQNETARLAHYILPPTFGLEHEHFPVLSQSLSLRNVAHHGRALVAPPPGCRDDLAIGLDLVRAIERARGKARGAIADVAASAALRLGARGFVDAMLRLGPHRLSLARVEASPDGLDLGPLSPRLPAIIAHKTGRIDTAPAPLLEDLGRLEAELSRQRSPGELLLIGRRSLRSNNSWMHNSKRLVSGKARCTLEVHPDDAARLGLVDGGPATLSSSVGEVSAVVETTARVAPGVVSMPHGWGHDREGTRLSVASERPGVCVNDVIADDLIDRPTGTSALNAVPVRVAAAR